MWQFLVSSSQVQTSSRCWNRRYLRRVYYC